MCFSQGLFLCIVYVSLPLVFVLFILPTIFFSNACPSLLGGVSTVLLQDGMTRAPIIVMPSVVQAGALKAWVEEPSNYERVRNAFNETSRFARLIELRTTVAGRNVFLRFKCQTGDAMGMNMITKGVTAALDFVQTQFADMQVVSVSGNMCVDKKPSAINWIDGRGKSVVCEAVVPKHIVEKVLKTSVDALVEVNTRKNLVGSAMAGSIGVSFMYVCVGTQFCSHRWIQCTCCKHGGCSVYCLWSGSRSGGGELDMHDTDGKVTCH